MKAGDTGTIMHIYPGGDAFVVEFLTLGGNTVVVADVLPSQARPLTDTDITHVRKTRKNWDAIWVGNSPNAICGNSTGKNPESGRGMGCQLGRPE